MNSFDFLIFIYNLFLIYSIIEDRIVIDNDDAENAEVPEESVFYDGNACFLIYYHYYWNAYGQQ